MIKNRDSRISQDTKLKPEVTVTQSLSSLIFNWVEPVILVLLTLNTMFYPNVGSAVYLIFVGVITVHSVSKEYKDIRFKSILCKAIIIIGLLAVIGK